MPVDSKPLKLVRLPVPPLPQKVGSPSEHDNQGSTYYFEAGAAGALGGCAVGPGIGSVCFGAPTGGGAGVPLNTDPEDPRWPMIESANANIMKSAAKIAVAFVSTVAPDRAPNAAWLLLPPNALAMSPPRPCCRRMTSDRTAHTRMNRTIST
jgi:hypothetical protein